MTDRSDENEVSTTAGVYINFVCFSCLYVKKHKQCIMQFRILTVTIKDGIMLIAYPKSASDVSCFEDTIQWFPVNSYPQPSRTMPTRTQADSYLIPTRTYYHLVPKPCRTQYQLIPNFTMYITKLSTYPCKRKK